MLTGDRSIMYGEMEGKSSGRDSCVGGHFGEVVLEPSTVETS